MDNRTERKIIKQAVDDYVTVMDIKKALIFGMELRNGKTNKRTRTIGDKND